MIETLHNCVSLETLSAQSPCQTSTTQVFLVANLREEHRYPSLHVARGHVNSGAAARCLSSGSDSEPSEEG